MIKYISSVIALFIVSVVILSGVNTVRANPSFFVVQTLNNATATTTRSYITAGTATTTFTLDTNDALGSAVDSAALVIQFTASTTGVIINWQYEYSQNGLDWYGDSYAEDTATSTSVAGINVSPFSTHSWTFASSSVGTSQSGTVNKLVRVDTPTRYVRAVFTVPDGSGPASIYSAWIAKKENR